MGEWDDAMAAMEVAVDYLPDPDAWPELWERVYGIKAFIAGHRDDVATVAADLARPKVGRLACPQARRPRPARAA